MLNPRAVIGIKHERIYMELINGASFPMKDLELMLSSIYNDCIKLCGCHYMALYIDDEKDNIKFACFSNRDWQKRYIANHFLRNCHIVKFGKKQLDRIQNTTLIIPWENLRPVTKAERKIHRLRRQHNIGDGLTLACKEGPVKILWTLCPEKNDKAFIQSMHSVMEDIKQMFTVIKQISQAILIELHETDDRTTLNVFIDSTSKEQDKSSSP